MGWGPTLSTALPAGRANDTHDIFLLLTPLMLLAIVGLLGHVGCYTPVTLQPRTVINVQTVVSKAPAGNNSSITVELTLQGNEFVIAVVQWMPTVVTDKPSLPPAFATIAGPFPWNGMEVLVYSAQNPSGSTQLPVTATLNASSAPWSLCVSAYSGVDEATPFYSPQSSDLLYKGRAPQTMPINTGADDVVYAVAFAANSDGTFPGDNTLAAGSGFTVEFTGITDPLVEDTYGEGGLVMPSAQINSSDVADPLGFIFAMGLKAQS